MALFDQYFELGRKAYNEIPQGLYEAALSSAVNTVDDYPAYKLEEADMWGIIRFTGRRYDFCVHYSCGHREVVASREEVGSFQFLFVTRMVTEDEIVYRFHVAVDKKCQSCTMQDFRRRMAPAFNELVWTHGLSAYSRTHTVREAVERLYETLTHNEWEICVTESDAHVGPYGLYLKGSLTGLFDGDVWSTVNNEGQRISDQAGEYDFVGDSVEKYLDRKTDEDHRYFEGFICQYECAGIWMTREASRKYKDLSAAMRAEAHRLGVPFTLV